MPVAAQRVHSADMHPFAARMRLMDEPRGVLAFFPCGAATDEQTADRLPWHGPILLPVLRDKRDRELIVIEYRAPESKAQQRSIRVCDHIRACDPKQTRLAGYGAQHAEILCAFQSAIAIVIACPRHARIKDRVDRVPVRRRFEPSEVRMADIAPARY